jgi:mRNA interferase MazF
MNPAQGEIYWVAFPPSDGREQMGRRPALIVQWGAFPQSLPTIWVIPITSNPRAAHFPGTICIDPNEQNGLTWPSCG